MCNGKITYIFIILHISDGQALLRLYIHRQLQIPSRAHMTKNYCFLWASKIIVFFFLWAYVRTAIS